MSISIYRDNKNPGTPTKGHIIPQFTHDKISRKLRTNLIAWKKNNLKENQAPKCQKGQTLQSPNVFSISIAYDKVQTSYGELQIGDQYKRSN